MGKIIKLKEENLIPESHSQEPVYPSTVSQATHTVYEEQYPGTPLIKGKQVIDVKTDLANLWAILGNTAIKPETLIRYPYDGNEHPLSVPSSCRYTLTYQGTNPPKDIGVYHYIAQLLPGYTWRDLTTEDVEVTLEIYATKSALPTNVVEGANVTFDSTIQELCVTHIPDNYTGTITYSLDGAEFSTTIPTATNANSYRIRVKCTEDDYYTALEFEVTAVISKCPLAYPTIISSYNYTGSLIQCCYTNGNPVSVGVQNHIRVLADSTCTATHASTNTCYFVPEDNYMWSVSRGTEMYALQWQVKAIPYSLTYTLESSYYVGDSINAVISDAIALNYYLVINNEETKISLPYTLTKADVTSNAQIRCEFAETQQDYSSISNPKSVAFSIATMSNVTTWHPSQVTNVMYGVPITLRASVTSGKVVYRLNSPVGEVVGNQPELVDGYWVTTWTPTAYGTFSIYCINSEWDDILYNQASVVSKGFVITAQATNTITWAADTLTHYLGDVLALPSDAVSNPSYAEVAKVGRVVYYKGDYSAFDDTTLPSVTPLSNPYTITASDLSGLTITAFNVDYDAEYVNVAKKVVKSINVSLIENTMTIGAYSPSAYIDTDWTWEVTVGSGSVDFQYYSAANDEWLSMYGDNRATIASLGNNRYRLTYQFLSPSGRTQKLRVVNTPAAGYKEPTNQNYTISVGVMARNNAITITSPTTESISVHLGDTISASAYATSGYVQFYNGNPDDTTNPGTLISEGYVSGNSGEPCSISNYAITKATTLIYMKNVGYGGAYSQATTKYFTVLASALVPLTLQFESGNTGTFEVGDTLTFDAKVYTAAGAEVSGFDIQYYVNGTLISGNTYTPQSSDAFTVMAEVTNPSAISGYIVNPSSTLKTYTEVAYVAWWGYSETFNDLPTEATLLTRSTPTAGFSRLNTTTSCDSPKTFWVAVLNNHTATITDSIGSSPLSEATPLGNTYQIYYKMTRAGFDSILNCVID